MKEKIPVYQLSVQYAFLHIAATVPMERNISAAKTFFIKINNFLRSSLSSYNYHNMNVYYSPSILK